MVTLSKNEVINSILLESHAQHTVLNDKAALFARVHGCSLPEFEKKIKNQPESFSDWDELIEWKACQAAIYDLEKRITEVEHGEYTFA